MAATALTLGMGAAAASPTSHTTAPAPEAKNQIVFGASGGAEIKKLAKKVHAPIAPHVFGHLNGPAVKGRLITMGPSYKWRQIDAAGPGSPIYKDIVRWANALKGRPGRNILFTFSHEPEGKASDDLGTNTQFIAAWRHIHDIFQGHGVRNVEYTWNMTSNSFRVSPHDDRYAPKWYPGNKYVDNVATAAYNWFNCGEGHGKWLSLESRTVEPFRFAKSHGKKYVLAEWASQAGPRRTAWLQDARRWFLANRQFIRGAFYYQTPQPRAGCSWRLTGASELSAFAKMARDRAVFGG